MRLALPALSFALALAFTEAGAATIAVTRFDDPAPDGCDAATGCSLREAIAHAASLPGADTVSLPAGEYLLSPQSGTLITIQNISEVTLSGAGRDLSVIRPATGGGGSMFYTLAPMTLRRLSLLDGNALGSTMETGQAAALRAQGAHVRLEDVLLENHRSTQAGAVLVIHGSLDVVGSTIKNNRSFEGHGAITLSGSPGRIVNSTFMLNIGVHAGAIGASSSPLTIAKGSRFLSNEASLSGGAIAANGAVTVDDSCEISGNRAPTGGAFYGYQAFSLTGVDAVGNGLARIANNEAEHGGAIATGGNASLARVDLVGNTATRAGGVYFAGPGLLTIEDSRIADNAVSDGGGGMTAYGTVELRRVSFEGNSAAGQGGAASFGNGAQVRMVNVDVHDNRAAVAAGVRNAGNLVVEHSTFTGNMAGHAFDALYQSAYSGSLSYANSVLGGRCNGNTAGIAALGRNLRIQQLLGYSCAGTSVSTAQLALQRGTFGGRFDVSGTTSAQSAIVDAGDTRHCAADDIRDLSRDLRCDAGAFEYGAK